MISARILAVSIPWVMLSASPVCAGDLSRYREFQLGTDLSAVVALVKVQPSEVKVIHQRPAVIQELSWQPQHYSGVSPEADPVDEVAFSFYNGELFQMVVKYDHHKTEGLTAEDMIEAISRNYGTATRPDAEIIFPSIYNETVKVLARWEDSESSVNLVRSSYWPAFGMVVFSKRLNALAQAAMIEAARLDQQEAPQREADLQKKQDEDNRVQQEKARLVNKKIFRP